ncbi:hypothetical protein [Marinicella rhabdoformis]|uniref:hypothetical protein n=1 Tax=Marinicella rhabdoformis TaxID=2580566 RepID=UPI0012AED1AA|nr:hypothetical protein [Marinicella rhabdoformis]
MNATLKTIGLIGLVLFGALFSVTYTSKETIESSAKSFVKFQIEKEIKAKQQAITASSMAEKARSMANKLGLDADKIQTDLENNLPDKIASVIAAMCGYDCEKKKAVSQSIAAGYMDRLKGIGIAQGTLAQIIKGKYVEIVGNLKFDLRIFLASNAIMFLILLMVSFFKPRAVAHLFLPGMLLLLATVISSSIYIFGQDWFYTIIYNDYMGFAYLAYLGIIFAVLMDIVFNAGSVTTSIINAIAEAVGSSLSLASC